MVFNSIKGLESSASVSFSDPVVSPADVQLRCQGLADVVLTNERDPIVLDGFSPDYEGMSDECTPFSP